MTREKKFDSVAKSSAIAVLEDELKIRSDVYAEYIAHGGKTDCGEEFYLDTLNMAIAALREQSRPEASDQQITESLQHNGSSGSEPSLATKNQVTSDKTSIWISVEDRLPDDSAGVNLCTRSGIVGTGFYDKYTKNWVQYYSGGALCVDVTHWMPLPEPPEVEA